MDPGSASKPRVARARPRLCSGHICAATRCCGHVQHSLRAASDRTQGATGSQGSVYGCCCVRFMKYYSPLISPSTRTPGNNPWLRNSTSAQQGEKHLLRLPPPCSVPPATSGLLTAWRPLPSTHTPGSPPPCPHPTRQGTVGQRSRRPGAQRDQEDLLP